jgi:hypothetical protein
LIIDYLKIYYLNLIVFIRWTRSPELGEQIDGDEDDENYNEINDNVDHDDVNHHGHQDHDDNDSDKMQLRKRIKSEDHTD